MFAAEVVGLALILARDRIGVHRHGHAAHRVDGGFAVGRGGVVHVHSHIHSVLLVDWIIGLVRYVIGLIQRGAVVDDDGRLVRRVGCGGAGDVGGVG